MGSCGMEQRLWLPLQAAAAGRAISLQAAYFAFLVSWPVPGRSHTQTVPVPPTPDNQPNPERGPGASAEERLRPCRTKGQTAVTCMKISDRKGQTHIFLLQSQQSHASIPQTGRGVTKCTKYFEHPGPGGKIIIASVRLYTILTKFPPHLPKHPAGSAQSLPPPTDTCCSSPAAWSNTAHLWFAFSWCMSLFLSITLLEP